jgi:sulfatase maturation enzyme AslB (radical SAM superfamily)
MFRYQSAYELQVQIDDVYACLGNCPGCVLSSLERATQQPDMDSETLDLALARIAEYIPHLDGLNKMNITYAIADHLLMPEGYVETIYAKAVQMMRAAGLDLPDCQVAFTTSLVGKHDAVLARLQTLAHTLDQVPLLPIVVLDPAKLYAKKFGDRYKDLIAQTKILFGQVDLAINLSDDAVQRISPQEFHDFAAVHQFGEVVINWTPTPDNMAYTAANMALLADWLIALDRIIRAENRISANYRDVMKGAIYSQLQQTPDLQQTTFAKVVQQDLEEVIRKSFEIDHHGHLYAKFDAIGDVPQSDRFGFKGYGDLKSASIQALLGAGDAQTKARIMRAYGQSVACQSCDVGALCAAVGGFHIYNHVLRKNSTEEGTCPHIAKPVLEYFLDIMAQDNELPEIAMAG